MIDDKPMTKKAVKAATRALTFVSVVWKSNVGEYRVAYKGLKPARAEAMEYFTDDGEDAIGTANTMERDYWSHVFEDDKLPETRLRDAALRNQMGVF
jgi:adenosylmethionine-8-amino-7-oxononanoate aminotransferase